MAALGTTELLIILVFVAVLLGGVAIAVVAVGRVARGGRGGVEARLQELDRLRASGAISEQEHAAARARALGL